MHILLYSVDLQPVLSNRIYKQQYVYLKYGIKIAINLRILNQILPLIIFHIKILFSIETHYIEDQLLDMLYVYMKILLLSYTL